MPINNRQEKIVKLINQQGKLSSQALADKFCVSVQTVRTDIRKLAERGLILRNHGEVMPFPDRENISYKQRQIRNTHGKEHIAKLCLTQIDDYQSLFLGSGSTVTELAKRLTQRNRLQIMTTNIHTTSYFKESSGTTLTLAGGRVRQRDQDFIGADAMRFYRRYRADIGIVCAGAVDKLGNLYDYNDDEMMAREALLTYCRYKILLIDHTKFDKELRCAFGHLEDFDCIISDKKPTLKLFDRLISRKIKVLY